jgi:hypothetical protein
MKSFILSMLLPEIEGLLQYFVKSPAALANEKKILTSIRDNISLILAALPPDA